jgi:hypothetical protein
MDWIISLLVRVREWVKGVKGYPFLALVLFALLIGAVGKLAGFTTDEITIVVVIIFALAVGAWGVGSLSSNPQQKAVVTWLLIIVFGMLALAVGVASAKRLLFPPTFAPRVPYTRQFIEIVSGSPATMLTPANLAVGANDDDKQLAAQNKIWEWVRDGLEWNPLGPDGKPTVDMSAGAVVSRSKSAFTDWHQTIRGVIDLSDDLKIEEGVIFLKSMQDGRMVYRQMRCKPDITSDDNGASFTLVDPNPNEELQMILRVRTRDGTPLSGNTNSYGINMRVNQ